MIKKINYKAAGFGLLEVMIALLVISSSLLGIAGLQTLALRHTQSAYYQTIAITQAQSMMERLRADPSADGQKQELSREQRLLANLLPQANCEYQCAASAAICTIEMNWQNYGSQNLSLSSVL